MKLADGGDGIVMENRPLYVLGLAVTGKPVQEHDITGLTYAGSPGAGSPEQRVHEQDQDGVDAEVLFTSTSNLYFWRGVREDAAYRALIHAYNEFLAEEYCAYDRDRLLAMALIPDTSVDDAIAELEYAAKAGLRGVAVHNFPSGKSYPSPDDDRFWAAALDLNMPVTVHVSFVSKEGPKFQYARNPGSVAGSADPVGRLTRWSEGGGNMLQLIMAGVFDRFPKLRIYWVETQIGWIPYFLTQTDDNYERMRYWAERRFGLKPLRRAPSEYLREHALWGFIYDPVGIQLRHMVGVDRAMWGSDFPHYTGDWPHSRDTLDRMFAGVSEDDRFKMTAGNAIKFFNLENAAPATSDRLADTATR